MKKLLTLIAILLVGLTAISQTLVIKGISSTPKSNGYYEYLPKGYNGVTKYPVIIFNHGKGEIGTGQPGQIESVLNNGLMKYLRDNATFRDTFPFIVIAPQYSAWPYGSDLNALVTYTLATYAVDINRVYVTGLSMGGGATWSSCSYNEELANKITAIVPICGAAPADSYGMTTIAKTGVAVWATHNNDDATVPVNYTNDWINGINARTPKIVARKTIWTSGGHNAWDRTHDPATKEFDGSNIWSWMLKFSRANVIIPPPTFTGLKLTTGNSFSTWTSDAIYISSQTSGWGNNNMGVVLSIAGTTEQQLYNTERFGTFAYAIPLANSTYVVKLHFAEIFWSTPGKRVFNVDIEGQRVLSNYDILSEVPWRTAIQKQYNVTVSDGMLNLNFISVVDKAKLTAIEIYPATTSFKQVVTVEYRDSVTNNLLKTSVDTFNAPVKVIRK